MSAFKYRVRTVTAEGFGGFANPQTVQFGERHVFLFGPNGQGKSSILEAIRWCLFGQAHRPDTEVRNTFYPLRECSVTLVLVSASSTLSMHRRFRPGTERSELTIIDSAGKEVKQAEVFPQLVRLGPKEGTHIIIAGQQPAARRPQADISDFSKVLYSYLQLEDVPDLLEELTDLIAEKISERDRLAGLLEQLKAKVRGELGTVKLKQEVLLKNPPWDGTIPPILSETERKIADFYTEITRVIGGVKEESLSMERKLDRAETASKKLLSVVRSKVDVKLREQSARLTALQAQFTALRNANALRQSEDSDLQAKRKDLSSLLNGTTLDQLRASIASIQEKMSAGQIRADIVQRANELHRIQPLNECPVCDVNHGSDQLTSILDRKSTQTSRTSDLEQNLEKLRETLKKALSLEELNRRSAGNMAAYEKQGLEAERAMMSLLEISTKPIDEEITSRINTLKETVDLLKKQLTDVGQAGIERDKKIKNLREELWFHDYQSEATRLGKLLADGMDEPQGVFEEYQSLLRTAEELRELLSKAFDRAIDTVIPSLDQMMTEVYVRLTRQASFDKVFVKRDGEGLGLMVGSTKCTGDYNPQDVLNGQANSALRLVPYFVFSEFETEALELELLLIDDPSQSFDTSHVESLLEELNRVGTRAQLIVASHETEKFEPFLHKYFGAGNFAVISVDGFEPGKGPKVEYRG